MEDQPQKPAEPKPGLKERIVEVAKAQRAQLQSVFKRKLPDYPHRKDLLQETLVRAFSALEKAPEDALIGAWLHGIAVNVARETQIEWYEKDKVTLGSREVDMNEIPNGKGKQPHEHANTNEAADRVKRALVQLDPEEQQVAELACGQDLTREQIAKVLGWTEAKVQYVWRSAKVKLEGLLRDKTDG